MARCGAGHSCSSRSWRTTRSELAASSGGLSRPCVKASGAAVVPSPRLVRRGHVKAGRRSRGRGRCWATSRPAELSPPHVELSSCCLTRSGHGRQLLSCRRPRRGWQLKLSRLRMRPLQSRRCRHVTPSGRRSTVTCKALDAASGAAARGPLVALSSRLSRPAGQRRNCFSSRCVRVWRCRQGWQTSTPGQLSSSVAVVDTWSRPTELGSSPLAPPLYHSSRATSRPRCSNGRQTLWRCALAAVGSARAARDGVAALSHGKLWRGSGARATHAAAQRSGQRSCRGRRVAVKGVSYCGRRGRDQLSTSGLAAQTVEAAPWRKRR